VVVEGSDRTRDVLVPIYAALGLAWDISTSGAIADEVPGVTWDDAVGAIERAFAEHHRLQPATLPTDLVDEARARAAEFEPSV
jgi:hypothetical protein